jgi:conjugal transfer ATP-binding protein TraC
MKKHPRHQASVQRDLLRLRETWGEMLCLSSPGSPTKRSYRAVLEVTPINLSLKAEDEQEALIERFAALIKSLSFPLQILVRNRRQDLTPYIQHLLAHPEGEGPHPSTWYALAHSQAELLQKIVAERTLIERHVYLIIPASQGAGRVRRRSGVPVLFGPRRAQRLAQTREQARQELALRAEALTQQLASCGLTSHRLNNADLARLYYQCLTPDRANAHPLSDTILSSVGRPSRVQRRSQSLPHDHVVRPVDSRNHVAPSTALAAAAPSQTPSAVPPAQREDALSPPLPDLLQLVDLLAPECIEITPDSLRIGQEYACGIAVTACPREVSFDGWLAPLFLHDDVLDISFHYHPQDTAAMKRQLQRNRAGHVSGRRFNRREGRADDPDELVAEEDLTRLLDDLARHRERVFDLGFYLLLRARSREALAERVERLYSVLALLSLDAATHPTTFEQAEVFQACLPQARDEVLRTFTLDSTTLATMFPFQSNSLSMPGGVLVGMSETHEPVLLNPWDSSLENPHLFIGGVTGSGKSYLGKVLVERDLLLNWQRGDQCVVIDPDLEYQQLAEALGGTVVRLAPGSAQHLNPFDLLPPRCAFGTYLVEASKGDRLAEKIQDLHAMLDIILAEEVTASASGSGMLTKREKGLIDRALYETYLRVGISGDPRTHNRRPPLLHDLSAILKSGTCGPDETDLSGRLSRYVSGSLSSLFSDVTSVDLASQLVVWDIRDMRGELRPLAISLIADRVWTQALYDSQRPRALYIDEAASLIEHPAGGHFLATLSRRARKRYLRLVTMTQNPEHFVQDPWGSVVASNAAIKVLKAQDATSAAAVAERFHLTPSEQQRLITFGRQEALVLAGGKRVTITIQASQREHALITTNPVERAAYLHTALTTNTIGPADAHPLTSTEALERDISNQGSVPLPALEEQEEAAQAMNTTTHSQRQSGYKRKTQR